VHYNNIYGNEPYDVVVKSSDDISGAHNYWGTVTSVDILAQVYDWYNDSSRGKFLYIPYLQDPDPDAPVPPPMNLQATVNDSSVTLSWDAIPSTTAGYGYKVYYDTDASGPPYNGVGFDQGASPIDVGDTTNYTLTGLSSGWYYWGVTAYDTHGMESWYSNEVAINVEQQNQPPTADASDINGQPQTMDPDTIYSVTAQYYDPDGRDDLKYCYLQLRHPSKPLAMMWDQFDGSYSPWAGEEGANYLTITSVTSTELANGHELTWSFRINDNWPQADNSIDFGVSARDDDDLESGWDYDNTNASFTPGAEPTYSISGQVQDSSGNPISGVTISDGAGHTATTDSNGNYTLSGLTAGTYTLTPSKSGYTFSPASRTVNVPPNATGQDFTGSPTTANVELVGQIGGATNAVAVQGHYAYLGVGPRLVVLDISNPANSTVVGQTEVMPGCVGGVAVAGNYAYVADGYDGLRIINVSDPAAPTETGFYETPGYANGVAVAGNYAYVADRYEGLRIINVSDPAAPSEAGFYDTPGYAEAVAVAAGDPQGHTYAYVADGLRGLRIINVSNPAVPSEIGFYETPGDALDVAVVGDYAYVADWDSGLRIINISDPATPTEAGFYDTPGETNGVAVAGNYAYVADWYGGLFILRFTGAEPTYSISGQVQDSSGNPISGVTISGGAGHTATTDASGDYTISNIVAGTYLVTVNKNGYEFSPAARVVRVPPDATDQDFTTTPVYGSLTGQVTDQDSGAAIASARISIGGKVGQTDANGDYTLTDILPGLHNTHISADGYEDYKGEVVVEANTSTIKDVALDPTSISGYYLPYPGGRTYECTQGNGGQYSHQGKWYYAFDFGMPDGHNVVVAQDGRVVTVKKDSNISCNSRACINAANYVRIRHPDGTDTLYYHLKHQKVFVEENEFVSRGQVIAESDTTGWCTGAHLDFTRHKWGQWNSIPVSFADVPGDGVPKTGGKYTSSNYRATQSLGVAGTTVDTDPPRGSVQFRLTGQPTHTLLLGAFDYITDVTEMRLATTEPDLQAASWLSFITRTMWTAPAVFAQFKDANSNVSAVVSDTVDAIGYEPIQAAFAVSPNVCVGRGLLLTNQTTPFCEQCGWLWDFGDGTTSEEAEPEFDYAGVSSFAGYASPGLYTVTLTATDALSVSAVSHQVEALPAPSADFTMIRSRTTITVEAEATEAASWTWDFGDGVTATGRIVTHTYTDTDLLDHYPVQLKVDGNNGCTSWGHQYVSTYSLYLPLILKNYSPAIP